MSNTIGNTVASYLTSLAATNEICSALGTTFTFGTNLFLHSEPTNDTDMVTIIPYGGYSPETDKIRQNPAIQLRMKSTSKNTLMSTQQAMINKLHLNQLGGNALMISNTSTPMIIGVLEGGEYTIAVTNFRLKHVKV